jgi:hypothetical protein
MLLNLFCISTASLSFKSTLPVTNRYNLCRLKKFLFVVGKLLISYVHEYISDAYLDGSNSVCSICKRGIKSDKNMLLYPPWSVQTALSVHLQKPIYSHPLLFFTTEKFRIQFNLLETKLDILLKQYAINILDTNTCIVIWLWNNLNQIIITSSTLYFIQDVNVQLQKPTTLFLVYSSLCIIQGEHKRTLHFQNYTENKCGVLRTSHLHQSVEKLSKFCTHITETRYVLHESHGRCRDDNPARPKLCAECPQWWKLWQLWFTALYQA